MWEILSSWEIEYASIDLLIINFILWIINLGLMGMIIMYIFYMLWSQKGRMELKSEKFYKINLVSWGLFFVLLFTANVLLVVTFFSTIKGEMTTELVDLLGKIMMVLVYVAFLAKIIYLEQVIRIMGHFFSIILTFIIFFIIFAETQIMKQGILSIIFLILTTTGYCILPLLYFYFAIKSTGKNRMDSFKICIGTVLLGLGLLFRPDNLLYYWGISEFLNSVILLTYITGPISIIISVVFIFAGFGGKGISKREK